MNPNPPNTGRQALKITAREGLRLARQLRLEGCHRAAADALAGVAEARQTLLKDYNAPALERELQQNLDGADFLSDLENPEAVHRRKAILAHLYNYGKAFPKMQ